MLNSAIIASGFTGRKEEYVGCVMKRMVNSKYFQLPYCLGIQMLVESDGIT